MSADANDLQIRPATEVLHLLGSPLERGHVRLEWGAPDWSEPARGMFSSLVFWDPRSRGIFA
ncbi:MAG TPA: hypothetical protein VD761_04595 [Solirubrobacterales bacterium]|nr:hypothetical protein [Solirubrobacterales bacterium]